MNMMATVAAAPIAMCTSRASAEPASNMHWDRVRDEFLKAKAALYTHDKLYARAWARYEELKPMIDPAVKRGLPGPQWNQANLLHRDLDKAYSDFCAGENRRWWSREPEEAKARVKAALDAVAAYRAADERAQMRSGCTKLDREECRLEDRFSEAETAMLKTPAPNREAALFKLEHLFGDETLEKEGSIPLWDTKWVRLVMADARRMLVH